nr:DUF72 domain-containing protein [Mesorhizobium sp. J428]
MKAWRDDTPVDFRLAWKASRFITHWRRLLVDENSFGLLDARLDLLGDKLGPVLFQLPPRMKADRERLASFISRLSPSRRWCFEFRHPSWYEEPVLGVLRDHNAALCLSDHADAPAPTAVTADWIYVRNHGPSGRYHGSYSKKALSAWAARMRHWRSEGRDIWCFFDNDVKSAAPRNAASLIEMLDP